jgi:hypothetical protein
MNTQKAIYGIAFVCATFPRWGWTDNDLFNIYIGYERAVSKCSDVPCYRRVLEDFGSRASQEKAADMADRSLQAFFEMRKKMATDRVEKAELYVTDTSVEDNSAVLQLASKTYPGLTETVYFVKENGTWKIGKE